MDQNPLTEGTPFNMAMLYYMQIQKLMDQLSTSMVENDLPKARELIEELYTKVSFKLSKEEKKELKGSMASIKRKFTIYSKTRSPFLPVTIKEMIRETNRDILSKMDKYNMIFPKIEVQGGIAKLEKRYGLGKADNNS